MDVVAAPSHAYQGLQREIGVRDSPEEPKGLVRGRLRHGSTLNFAKPAAWATTFTTIAALIAIVYVVNNPF